MKLLRNLSTALIFTGIVAIAMFGSGCNYVYKIIAKDKLNQGVIKYNEGQREEAKKFFLEATEYDPDNAVAWLYYGATLLKDYREEEENQDKRRDVATQALKVFEKALALSGDNCVNRENAISNIAVIYDDLKDDDNWRTWRLKLAEDQCATREGKINGYYVVATRYFNCSHDQTNRYQDKSRALAGDSWHYRNMDYPAALPDKRRAEDCTTRGLEYIEKALQVDPEHVNSLYYKGLLYRERQMLTKDPVKRKELGEIAQKLNDQATALGQKQEEEKKQKKEAEKQRQQATSRR
jgi:tetratricopeptide (TPR) repeat protein